MDELSWRQRGRLWLRLGLRAALLGLFLLALYKLALPLLGLLMPFVLGLVVAWVFNPIIRFLQKKLPIPRGALSLILLLVSFAVVGGLLFAFLYAMTEQVVSLAQNWQSLWDGVQGTLNAVTATLEDWFRPLPQGVYDQAAKLLEGLTAWLSDVVPDLLSAGATQAGSFALSLPSLVVSVFIFIMAAYFISADYPRLRFLATAQLPGDLRAFLSRVKKVAVAAFGGYVKAQLILSFFIFWILLLGFLLIRQPYALLLALALAVLDFIPIVGSGTVMVPWAVIDLVLGNYLHAIALMVIWGVIAIFRQVGEPKAVGDQTGLSPIVSLLAIYVGMRLGGVLGMILGPVVCMVLLNLIRSGLFDGALADVRLAVRDVTAILKTPRDDPPPPAE